MTGRALVIGGGIGGLAAGLALRRAGWDVQVFERAPRISEVGAGISLWVNGIRALESLGLRDALTALSMAEPRAAVYEPDGALLASLDWGALRAKHGPIVQGLHRAELQGMLNDSLGSEYIRCDARFVSFTQDDRGVRATFADGSTAEGDVLIGADGIHSAVRAQLFGDAPPRYAGYTAWRAVVATPDALHDGGTGQDGGHLRTAGETLGAGARFGIVPLTKGRVYWFGVKDAPPGARSPDGEKAELLRTFGDWHAAIPALIRGTPDEAILRHDIVDRPPLSRWTVGRVTLLGDAAHAMTPNLGQGACQALEDAVVVADSLAVEPDVASALLRYEERRRPRANAYVRDSWNAGRIAQWSHPLAVALRTAVTRMGMPIFMRQQVGRMVEGP